MFKPTQLASAATTKVSPYYDLNKFSASSQPLLRRGVTSGQALDCSIVFSTT